MDAGQWSCCTNRAVNISYWRGTIPAFCEGE
jgi:hypothetical protein